MIPEKALVQAAIDEGLVDDHQVSQARMIARKEHKDLVKTLSYAHRIPEVSFYRAFAQHHELLYLNSGELTPNIKLARKCGFNLLQSRKILPIVRSGDSAQVHIVCINLPDNALKRQLNRVLGDDVQFYLAEQKAIETIIQQIEPALNPLLEVGAAKNDEEFEPARELDRILDQAYLHRASDVHLECLKEQMVVRIRVDGRLQEMPRRYNKEQGNGLISRIKVLSRLDIAESRMPQDGGMNHVMENGQEFDIRVATMPAQFGERATLRLLGTETALLSLKQLGMDAEELNKFSQVIQKPHGMILITGPTGSGKSTTLYAALNEINSPEVNILTAEDPVEQPLESISQLQVGVKVSFAKALRSFLRHDPDVIMVGEIRDGETADIAMKAAMTGHLVFSTLHTNTSVACINRLRDIGVESYLIASTLLVAIAQRLARKLCDECKTPYQPSQKSIDSMNLSPEELDGLYQPEGCAHCSNTGYRGRVALFETLWINEPVKEAIVQGVSEQEILSVATDYTSLADDGRRKFVNGLTSFEELQRLALVG